MTVRIIGLYLLAVAVVVGIHTAAEPVYYVSTDAAPVSPLWDVLDYFSAIAIVVAAWFAWVRYRDALRQDALWDRMASSVQFYGLVIVAVMFFWAWFTVAPIVASSLWIQPAALTVVWVAVDALMVALVASVGGGLLARTGE